MHCQMNPFIQHAVRHGQMLLNESTRSVELSHSIISACDNIIFSINSGDLQGAVNSAQNARNMSIQAANASQQLNSTINERLEMASYVLSQIQYRFNELSTAIQSLRGTESIHTGGTYYPEHHYHTSADYQPATSPYML